MPDSPLTPKPCSRRSIRLEGYDYATPGEYFITICAYNHQPTFGSINSNEMCLNTYGEILRMEWEKTPSIRKEIELGAYQIMPNHFHAIVHINDVERGKGDRPVAPTDDEIFLQMQQLPHGPSKKSLGALVAGFKSSVTTRINTIRKTPGASVWQRNYYEHIITSEKKYLQIETYILNNPANWAIDDEYKNYLTSL